MAIQSLLVCFHWRLRTIGALVGLSIICVYLIELSQVLHKGSPSLPVLQPIATLLHWNVLDPVIPTSQPGIFEGTVRRIDWNTERDVAKLYRDHDVPFILLNVPDMLQMKETWTDDWLSEQFGTKTVPTRVSETGQFLYYDKKKFQKAKKREKRLPINGEPMEAPTTAQDMTFATFAQKTKEDGNGYTNSTQKYYFIVSVKGPNLQPATHKLPPRVPARGEDVVSPFRWLGAELKLFHHNVDTFFLVNENKNRGINCRFGQPGIHSVAHLDFGRNFIALMKGYKRYILFPPSDCEKMYPLPQSSPSARHSQVDWTNPDLEEHPLFSEIMATQVVLQPGEIMYLPSYWGHAVSSVGDEISAQCNGWSGIGHRFVDDIIECGFNVLPESLE